MRKEQKRSVLALFMAFVTVFTLSLLCGVYVSAEEEYVFFESFENGKGSWTNPGGGSRTDISSEQASDGEKSVKITDDSSTTQTGNFRSPKIERSEEHTSNSSHVF